MVKLLRKTLDPAWYKFSASYHNTNFNNKKKPLRNKLEKFKVKKGAFKRDSCLTYCAISETIMQ